MKYSELNSLYWLKEDIKALEEELGELGVLGGNKIDNMPKTLNSNSDKIFDYIEKKNRIIKKLENKRNEFYSQLEKIENYIDKIEDHEISIIARRRFILCQKWEDIGKEINLDRTCCYRKMINYINKV